VAASVLFSLAHGPPLPPTRERLALSLFLFGGGMLLGFVCEHVGMIAAMVAHAAYDFVLLMIFRRQWLAGGVSAGAPG
jgi:hypothetical protein